MLRQGYVGNERSTVADGQQSMCIKNPCSSATAGITRRRLSAVLSLPLIILSGLLSASEMGDGKVDASDRGKALEVAFARDRNLRVLQRVQDLPADVRDRLTQFRNGWSLANVGEMWAARSDSNDQPDAQHIFSAVSDTIAASLIVSAGGLSRPRIVSFLLAFRDSPDYCVYAFDKLILANVRVDFFQSHFEPDNLGAHEPPGCTWDVTD